MFEAPRQLMSAPAATLDQLRNLGVDDIRISLAWGSFAPHPDSRTRPTGFDLKSPSGYAAAAWMPYDAIIRDAAQRGIQVDVTLQGPGPLWASGPGAPADKPYVWRPDPRAFGDFVHAVATRYNGTYKPSGQVTPLPRVSLWSIWNEPNYGIQLAPQAIDHSTIEVAPGLYRGLLNVAWSALHATGHGGDTILIGDLAPHGVTSGDNPGNFNGMVPLRFLRALYCVDGSLHILKGSAAQARGCAENGDAASFVAANPALFQAQGFAIHPYPPADGLAPDDASADLPDYADLATLGRFEHTLDQTVVAYGSSKRFWIYDTEYGYKTNPPYVGGSPPAIAAAYMNQGEYMHWKDPRLRSYDQFLLVDPPITSNHFVTGLRFADGKVKPSYRAFRLAIFLPVRRATAGQRLEVWGCVRPAPNAKAQTGSQQYVRVQFAPSGTSSFQDLESVPIRDPHGYIDEHVQFRRSGTVRLTWKYPDGQTVHSRPVSITVG